METQITVEITQNSDKILLFFMNKTWPIQCSCFVANVAHVSGKYEVISQSNRGQVHVK